jgi:hypothetical protein
VLSQLWLDYAGLEAVAVDWLDRHRETQQAVGGLVLVSVGETPVYILEKRE